MAGLSLPDFSTLFLDRYTLYQFSVVLYDTFFVLNKTQSLFPSIVAHIVSNIGVFIIKLAQGHVSGLY